MVKFKEEAENIIESNSKMKKAEQQIDAFIFALGLWKNNSAVLSFDEAVEIVKKDHTRFIKINDRIFCMKAIATIDPEVVYNPYFETIEAKNPRRLELTSY